MKVNHKKLHSPKMPNIEPHKEATENQCKNRRGIDSEQASDIFTRIYGKGPRVTYMPMDVQSVIHIYFISTVVKIKDLTLEGALDFQKGLSRRKVTYSKSE